MIDHDISTADAYRMLSTPAAATTDRLSLSRRRFLQGVGAGLGGAMVGGFALPGMLGWDDHRAEAAPIGATDGILLVVGMYGGNDGLRMVAPVGDPNYDRLRQSVKVTPQNGLMLSGDYAFAPELVGLKSRWDAGKVAVVHGAGYANPDLSHFSSMAYWMSGRPNGVPSSGWVGRWLDIQSTNDVFRAATVGYSIPLHMQGTARRGIGVPPWGVGLGGRTESEHTRAYQAFQALGAQPNGAGPWMKAIGANVSNVITVGQGLAPVFDDAAGPLPDDDLARRMVVAARMINENVGLRVIDMGWGDFDHHNDEVTNHPARMTEFDNAVSAFYAALAPQWHGRVTIMTFSEFGRTPFDNESEGTDHGTCHPMLVIGDAVRGGFYSEHPNLSTMVEDWDRMDATIDFRSVYASVLDGWLGGGSSEVLDGTFEDLRLFRHGPGGEAAAVPQLRVKGDFTPLAATRIFSSASGAGSPSLHRALNAGEIVSIAVAGRGGVPSMTQANAADVPTAVVLHVTASSATTSTDFTVWASDDPRPSLISGSPRDADPEPTVVVTRIGADGKVNLRNRAGKAQYTVDVVGFFRGKAASRLTPVPAAHLLDTRTGLGGTEGKVRTLDVKVTGRGGVPSSGVTSVLLNVSTTGATSDGSLVVWPTGSARPSGGCAPISKGIATRRLVLAKVGTGGKVSFACTPSARLVVDVVGWFGTSGASRHVSVEPVAVLDTRTGLGRAAGTVGTSAFSVAVRGVGDVPSSGVGSFLLEVTASGASTGGHLTVWPTGKSKPDIVHLTSRTDRQASNLVLVKPGTDGKVTFAHSAGTVHLRADVVGWFSPT